MKFGFKTRNWGAHISDIRFVLDAVAKVGYKGIEISQRPEALGCNGVNELRGFLEERELTLINLTCGMLDERLKYLNGLKPQYLSIKHWDIPAVPHIIQEGIVPALHPGMFTPIKRVSDLVSLIERHPEIHGLKIICDTAHITIAGDNLTETIVNAKELVAAIHLKDWSPEYGRAGPRYSRGFTELGNGVVKLKELLQELKLQEYEGWIITENDSSQFENPLDSVINSAKWLASLGLVVTPPENLKSSRNLSSAYSARKINSLSAEEEARFRQAIMYASTKDIKEFHNTVLNAYMELIPCHFATLWTCSPTQDQIGLVYIDGENLNNHKHKNIICSLRKGLTGISIERQASNTRFDLTLQDPGNEYRRPERAFEIPDLLEVGNIHTLLSIPIFGSDHRNYTRFILNLAPKEVNLYLSDEDFSSLGQAVSIAADIVLDRACAVAASKTNQLVAEGEELVSFLEKLVRLVINLLKCASVAIFIVSTGEDKLELKATTGTIWNIQNDTYYRKGEGITGDVWKRNEPFVKVNSLRQTGHISKSYETGGESKRHACLWVPLVDSKRQVIGVIRCSNKHLATDSLAPDMFTDEDAAVLDAICQAAVPHLRLLLDEARRKKALGRLTHELANPLASIRGATNLLMNIDGLRSFLPYDYAGDIWSWSDLMQRLLLNADIFRISSGSIPLKPVPTHLRADVIAPAVKQTKMLLEERNFSYRKIHYGTFEQIPRLHIDQNMFQQVIFNLLSNAIKYSFEDPSAFDVEIDGEKTNKGFAIYFRNWGPGIDIEYKDKIFDEEYRTPEANQRNITGQGLGLWVVRRIVTAHGGSISLTNAGVPTEFTIILPESLARQSPISKTSRSKIK